MGKDLAGGKPPVWAYRPLAPTRNSCRHLPNADKALRAPGEGRLAFPPVGGREEGKGEAIIIMESAYFRDPPEPPREAPFATLEAYVGASYLKTDDVIVASR
jgi:hypothetical protein